MSLNEVIIQSNLNEDKIRFVLPSKLSFNSILVKFYISDKFRRKAIHIILISYIYKPHIRVEIPNMTRAVLNKNNN